MTGWSSAGSSPVPVPPASPSSSPPQPTTASSAATSSAASQNHLARLIHLPLSVEPSFRPPCTRKDAIPWSIAPPGPRRRRTRSRGRWRRGSPPRPSRSRSSPPTGGSSCRASSRILLEVIANDGADHREHGRHLQPRKDVRERVRYADAPEDVHLPAAYERMSSIWVGRTDVSPAACSRTPGRSR